MPASQPGSRAKTRMRESNAPRASRPPRGSLPEASELGFPFVHDAHHRLPLTACLAQQAQGTRPAARGLKRSKAGAKQASRALCVVCSL